MCIMITTKNLYILYIEKLWPVIFEFDIWCCKYIIPIGYGIFYKELSILFRNSPPRLNVSM